MITNSYGICISNSEDFGEKTIMENLNSLEGKHRVSVLLPTAMHMWHKPSSALFEAVFDGFIDDIRKLSTKGDEFVNNLGSQNIKLKEMKQIIEKLRVKYINGTTQKQDQKNPAVFGVKLFTTQVPPVKIVAPILLMQKGEIIESKWKYIAKPSYLYSALILKLTGFKITKNGISLDIIVECLLYNKMAVDKIEKKSIYLTFPGIKKLKKELNDSEESSDDEVNEYAF